MNALAFQLVWFSTIIGASEGYVWIGPGVLVTWSLFHFVLSSAGRLTDLCLLVSAVSSGWVLDSLVLSMGWVSYSESPGHDSVVPAWMAVLWAGYALTFNHSLKRLHNRVALAACLGAAGGPVAFFAGSQFEVVQIIGPVGFVAIAAEYAIATGGFTWFCTYLNNRRPRPVNGST
jgi:hypothetical protein